MEKTYRLFESTVRSDVELLLHEGKGDLNIADLQVTLDPALKCAPTSNATVERCEFGLHLRSKILNALVSQTGDSVRMFPMPGVEKELLTFAFLGGIFQAALFFRGMLQLHASAVADGTGATCFCGISGSGKSTAAAWYVKNGFRLVDEDRPVIFVKEGRPYVIGHNRCFSLLPDAHKQFSAEGWISDGNRCGYSGLPKERLVPHNNATAPIAPLTRIVLLRRGPPCEIRKCSGVRLFPELLENVLMSSHIQPLFPDRMFELIERSFSGVELLEVSRPDKRQWWPQVEGLLARTLRYNHL